MQKKKLTPAECRNLEAHTCGGYDELEDFAALLQLPGKSAKSRRTPGYTDITLESPQYVHEDTPRRGRKK